MSSLLTVRAAIILFIMWLMYVVNVSAVVAISDVSTENKDILLQESFEGEGVEPTTEDAGTAQASWERLQGDFPFAPFSTSDAAFYHGKRSLAITPDGLSWGSVLSHAMKTETPGEVSVYYYDSLEDPKGYVYLGVTELDPVNNPRLGKKGGLSLGVNTAVSKDHYTYCPTQDLAGCLSSQVRRTKGWHVFTVRVTPLGSFGMIDGSNLAVLPGNKVNKALNYELQKFGRINLGINTTTDKSTYFFDLLTIKKLAAPPESQEVAYDFIQKYLTSYGDISITQIDRLIKARKSDFCSVDYASGASCLTGPQKDPCGIIKNSFSTCMIRFSSQRGHMASNIVRKAVKQI
ncbi:MAG: hypothetical protein UZ21_OP11001000530 [Microgenomates bacterium OLB22]|nr:MAG: hypothetical protein UZ21_OP11001000530 [Microgenomates bacterium OLB22]